AAFLLALVRPVPAGVVAFVRPLLALLHHAEAPLQACLAQPRAPTHAAFIGEPDVAGAVVGKLLPCASHSRHQASAAHPSATGAAQFRRSFPRRLRRKSPRARDDRAAEGNPASVKLPAAPR